MSRFQSSKTVRVDISDTEFVEVLDKIGFEKYTEIIKFVDRKEDNALPMFKPFLLEVIKGWNFKDDEGDDVPCTPEFINKLDSATVILLVSLLSPRYAPEKKS